MMEALENFSVEEIQRGNDRLMALAEYLETADDEHARRGERPYDQGTIWHHRDINGEDFPEGDERRGCGTPGCASGHASVLFEKERDYDINHEEPFFAMGDDEYCNTFGSVGCNFAKSAKQASDYIKALVEQRRLELSQMPSEEPKEEGDPLDLVGP